MRPIFLAALGAIVGAVLGTPVGFFVGGFAFQAAEGCFEGVCGFFGALTGIAGLFGGAVIGALVAIRLSRPDSPPPGSGPET